MRSRKMGDIPCQQTWKYWTADSIVVYDEYLLLIYTYLPVRPSLLLDFLRSKRGTLSDFLNA